MICNSQKNTQYINVANDKLEDLINIENINDTIYRIIEGKKILCYIKGHHGHVWSSVIPYQDYYILIAGNTRSNDYHIDTIFVKIPILTWGFDSMAQYSEKMQPIERDSYWPFYERLVLYSPEKEIMFDSNNTDDYSGDDSADFNEKLKNLKYFMYWSTMPIELQEKLPSPIPYDYLRNDN